MKKTITSLAQRVSKDDSVRMAVAKAIDSDETIDMAYVSEKVLKRNHAYMYQFLIKGVPRQLKYEDALALSKYFGIELVSVEAHVNVGKDASRQEVAQIAGKASKAILTVIAEMENKREIDGDAAQLIEKAIKYFWDDFADKNQPTKAEIRKYILSLL